MSNFVGELAVALCSIYVVGMVMFAFTAFIVRWDDE
jgi:hypothetical protein